MSYDKKFDREYQNIRGTYDANYNNPTQGAYNGLKNSIYEFKSTNHLTENLYNSVNKMQQNFGQKLGGLKDKINGY